jgi:sarcosine oxidase subunit delta
MRIPCPYCGDRDIREFLCRGEAVPRRPDAKAGTEAFHDYVYLRNNIAGAVREYWYHAAGCRSWLIVDRDAQSHAVTGACFASEAIQ